MLFDVNIVFSLEKRITIVKTFSFVKTKNIEILGTIFFEVANSHLISKLNGTKNFWLSKCKVKTI